MRFLVILLASLFFGDPIFAEASGATIAANDFNPVAVGIFCIFVMFTLGITWRAAKVTQSREAFYTASGGISPLQNGFAIAGDFMSAATLLGITGLLFFTGIDAMLLSFPVIIGWTLSLVVIAEKLRNLGEFTFVDVISYRLKARSLRVLLVICSLVVVTFYLIGQMIGAGKLIQLLFGLNYNAAVIIVSTLMVVYVYFGGMIATTWVQMLKAGLLMIGGAMITLLLLSRFGFDFTSLMSEAADKHRLGNQIGAPGGWLKSDPINVLTVGLTLVFGIMGLPHVLMRFLTVKDAKGARSSVGIATLLMSVFYIFILIIGFGAIAILWNNPEYYTVDGELIGESNMVALHAAKELGGDYLLGFMSAVAFATILAVVAGLTLSGAAAISHDLYANVIKNGESDPATELRLSRIVTLAFGGLSIVLAIAFENQNIAVVTAIALAVAASVNFPLLALSIYWKGLTSRGAVVGGSVTLFVSLILVILSNAVWVQILGNEQALFPYIYPTIFTLPIGFVSIVLFSLMDHSDQAKSEKDSFEEQLIRAETGVGASKAAQH